jgi:elongation factor Ts
VNPALPFFKKSFLTLEVIIMAQITAAMVKEIRELTGAGMLDSKNALEEANGDIEKAKIILREKGLAAAAKKSGRVATEGMVESYIHGGGNVGVLVEINSETDFVAKNELFREFAHEVAVQIAEKNATHVRREEVAADASGAAVLLEQSYYRDEQQTIEQLLNEKIAKIGENITIRRFVRFQTAANQVVESYIHGGGKIGVLVEISAAQADLHKAAIQELARELAMQIAAENAKYIERAEVPSDELNKEKEILRNQALNEGKPEKIVDKMVEGRISKYYEEVCLLEQSYFRNQDQTIAQLIKEKSEKIGDTLTVSRFVRFQLGEGLEKKQDDFVAEVMAQAKL